MAALSSTATDPTPIYAQLESRFGGDCRGPSPLRPSAAAVRQLAVDCGQRQHRRSGVYQDLERAGVIETRRGVGSFVSAGVRATPAPRQDKARHLRAFVTPRMADAAGGGFTAEDV